MPQGEGAKNLQEKIEAFNASKWAVKDNLPPCEKCGNKRFFEVLQEGRVCIKHCSCLAEYQKTANLSHSENAIKAALAEKTLSNFEIKSKWQAIIRASAAAFCQQEPAEKLPFFAVFAQHGAGKTHLLAAIANNLKEYAYLFWPESALKLKNLMVNDFTQYTARMEALKNAECLFIDSFFDGKTTDTDRQIAMELLFYRSYCHKITLIACPVNAAAFAAKNPAIFGQIRQSAGKFFFAIAEKPDRNWYNSVIDFL